VRQLGGSARIEGTLAGLDRSVEVHVPAEQTPEASQEVRIAVTKGCIFSDDRFARGAASHPSGPSASVPGRHGFGQSMRRHLAWATQGGSPLR
jgi:hypothetical protein